MRRLMGAGGWALLSVLAAVGGCGSGDPPRVISSSSGGSTAAGGSPPAVTRPTPTEPFSSFCAVDPPDFPLRRRSLAELDDRLDALFPAGPRLADTLGGTDARDTSLAFVQTLLNVATARVEAERRDQPAPRVCEDESAEDIACVEPWLLAWGAKLYLRPLEREQLAGYVAQFRAVSQQRTPEEAAKGALISMLLSPYFVLRIELGEPGKPGRLTQHELAARLSHFATRRAPDAELTARADAGELQTTPQVVVELHRLWALPEGRAARRHLILEWLGLEGPHPRVDLEPELLADMDAQLNSLLDSALAIHNGSLSELLTSSTQTITPRLAEHYGLPNPLFTEPYAGVLSTGAFLTRNPGPTRRGVRILSALLCQGVPAPPPDHASIVLAEGATPRERITRSVAQDAICPKCHSNLDGPGFALEAFDDAGRLTGFDTTGSLKTTLAGTVVPLAGPLDLGTEIAKSQAGAACAARHLLEYALDRRLPAGTLPLGIGPTGFPSPPQPSSPEQAWLTCVTGALSSFEGNLIRVMEGMALSALIARDRTPSGYVVAVDTSADPLQHAYQETLQFRGIFGQEVEEAVVDGYAYTLLRLIEDEQNAAGGMSGGGAGGAP